MKTASSDARWPLPEARKSLVCAGGVNLSGRVCAGSVVAGLGLPPLIVAIHGGGYTSAYFDVEGFSLLQCAARVGLPSIAIDRPLYGESTGLAPETATIANNAALLSPLIGKLWQEYRDSCSGVVLVGHSIGAAIVLMIASTQPEWPLLGLATSGCLLNPSPSSAAAWSALPDVPMISFEPQMKDMVLFLGPQYPLDPRMPAASHVADAPLPRAELIDIVFGWPKVAHQTLAEITVPVFHRQGAHDSLWVSSDSELDEFRRALGQAREVDARLYSNAGHCLDFDRIAYPYQLELVAFAHRCAMI